METVFIAGSIAITRLDQRVKDRISKVVGAGLHVAVGDADGADSSIQQHLAEMNAREVTVYCSGSSPRNNIGNWEVKNVHSDAQPGSRAYFTAKDVIMAEASNYGLMIWDTKSTGTLSNVIELMKHSKNCVVFINKIKAFVTIKNHTDLEFLLNYMSDHARQKAENKIGLASKVAALKQPLLAL